MPRFIFLRVLAVFLFRAFVPSCLRAFTLSRFSNCKIPMLLHSCFLNLRSLSIGYFYDVSSFCPV
jgi:hypothetical protein